MDAYVLWWEGLSGLAEFQGGLGGVGCAGLCTGPPHLPLLVTGTVCCPSFGCRWKDLAPSPAPMVLGTAQPCQPLWVLSAQILGSPRFSITEALGGVLSHLHWAVANACWERPPLGQQQILFLSSGFALLGVPVVLLHFFACRH